MPIIMAFYCNASILFEKNKVDPYGFVFAGNVRVTGNKLYLPMNERLE